MDRAYLVNKEALKSSQYYEFFNGIGGFVEEGREYEILLDAKNKPPTPWINVIANKNFGFHISESGAGYTWAANSRENKITSWSNDPVCDTPSEVIYIKDELSGRVMTPTSLGRITEGNYRVRHGFGYSKFFRDEDELEQELTVFTPVDETLKLWQLEITNNGEQVRYLTMTYYVEWVLGVNRDQSNPYVLTTYNNENEYLCAKSIYNYHFRKHQAFLFSSEMITEYTGDREEFLGQKGSVYRPQGLEGKLSCSTGVCYDSCGVVRVSVAIGPMESKVILFGLGYSDDIDEIDKLRLKYKDVTKAAYELIRVRQYWEDILGKVKIETTDRAMDILVNGWLLYQTLACRMNARAAFYQCGGAYGFRDQLQDSLAFLFTKPEILKNQILTSASRQYEEGDVQHWWHPPIGVGVRTKITDDLLWLPYTTAEYINATGDYTILKENVFYIKGPELAQNQHEGMFTPEISEKSDTIYEHCKKTILHTKFGKHGLPLMGGGDWNDGMNTVGIEGVGESVWLAWFFYAVLGSFIPLCRHEKDIEFAEELDQIREELLKNIEEHAWDGEWYIRAFYDDGTKLGSKDNDECRIDSISQSWSVISQKDYNQRTISAMQSAIRYLIIEKEGVSLLLYPPFDKTNKNPGYIKKYYPGIRENGGQYTHAAVWLAIAAAMTNDYDLSYSLFTMLNPIHICSDKKGTLQYEKEPYVMTADISFHAPYTGRGGWSWYTGSAGWMYQGLMKEFLGIKKEKDELVIDSKTPASFGSYTVHYKHNSSIYSIKVERVGRGIMDHGIFILDGVRLRTNRIKLVDDGKQHLVTVFYG